MSEVYEPNAAFKENAHVQGMKAYRQEYERSIADPEAFWAEKAESFHWFKKWNTICSYNLSLIHI